MDIKKIGIIAAVVIVLLVIIGVFASGGLGGSSDTVTIGYLPSDHDAALFVADAQGLYEKQGIKTELVQFNNGGDLMTAMASGDVDVGYVGITPVLSSIEKGVPVKVISAVQTEGSGIVVTKDSGISSAKDLVGKSIATPGEASIQHALLAYYLKENGLSLDDVKVSSMKVPSMNDALNTGKIDAIITFQPYVSIAAKNDNNKVLANSTDILPNHPCCVVAASDDFLNKNPDTAKAIVDIHKEATDFINKNPDKVVDLLPEDIVSDEDSELESIESFPFISGIDDKFKSDVDDFMGLEVELGLLKEVIPQDKIYWKA
ncbi:putative aliphatic sulfonates-binding protein precursor [Methanobrevibacter oralis]|uniref:Aliphatic sulfonates-binding protein n=1 Tax=Methanobrevibacter oralis TaxID=66851 RepID=A0A166B7W6_METOA|nr:ABC transporter substrate-binding protein [Methanobrevibacter oralis]KZX12991.1 putative aliphatic sulfonates-binding protein precursor [Methanobrevibacter oralis]